MMKDLLRILLLKVQNIINKASELTKEYAPEQVEEINSEIKDLWAQLL